MTFVSRSTIEVDGRTPVALVPITVDGRTVHVPRRLVKAVHRGLIDPDSL